MKNNDPWTGTSEVDEAASVEKKPIRYLTSTQDYVVFLLALISGILIWALSSLITGQQEPWDSGSPYYFISLFVSGAVFGAIKPARYSRWVLAIFIGQLIALIFIGMGPLIIIGIGYLAVLSMITLSGAAIAAALNNKLMNDR
jgi:hypothetical protein